MEKVNNRKSVIKYIFVIIAFFIMTFNFSKNEFKLSNPDWFKNFQYDSESLVLGKIINSRDYGIKNSGGLLGFSDGNFYDISQKTQNNYQIYGAQSGAQGILFSIIDRNSNLDPKEKLDFFYLVNSSLLSLFLSLMILFFINEIGLFSGVFIFLGILYSPWLSVAGKNLYWILWTHFFPIVTLFYYLNFRNFWDFSEKQLAKYNKLRYFELSSVVFIILYFKFLNGFEYVSQILITIELPLIYFSIKNNEKLKNFSTKFIFIAISGLMSFLIAILTTLFQISYAKNISLKKSFHDLFLRVAYRTGISKENYEIADVFLPSLESERFEIIKTYFLNSSIISNYNAFELSLLLLLFSFILWYYLNYFSKNLIALNIITIISLLGPISWIILAKGHSFIHTHINYMLFNIPFSILLCAFIGGLFQEIMNKFMLTNPKA